MRLRPHQATSLTLASACDCICASSRTTSPSDSQAATSAADAAAASSNSGRNLAASAPSARNNLGGHAGQTRVDPPSRTTQPCSDSLAAKPHLCRACPDAFRASAVLSATTARVSSQASPRGSRGSRGAGTEAGAGAGAGAAVPPRASAPALWPFKPPAVKMSCRALVPVLPKCLTSIQICTMRTSSCRTAGFAAASILGKVRSRTG